MNSKNAIKNVADVPNKFNKTGGEISGSIYPNTHRGLDIGKLNKSFNNIYCGTIISSDPDSYNYNGSLTYAATQDHQEGAWILDNYSGSLTVGQYGTDIKGSNNTGLRYNDNVVYHAGNKPPSLSTARTITLTGSVTGSVSFDGSKNVSLATTTNHTHDYLPLSGGTLTGETTFNNYLSINSWPNYGTGKAKLWFDGNSKNLIVENASTLRLGNNVVYHTANKPTPTDIGAIPTSKITISKTAPSNPSTGDLWISW